MFVLAATIGVDLERYVAVLQIEIKGSSQRELLAAPGSSEPLAGILRFRF